MKRKIFAGAVLFSIFLLLTGCAHLVINPDLRLKPEEMPTAEEIGELNSLLNSVVYPKDYKLDIFDCSNMAAYLYDFLTARGYRCIIVDATTSLWRLIFGDELVDRGHTWLIVGKNNKKFWVEPTAKLIAPSDWYENYFWQLHFYSLKEARRFWKIWHLPEGEWDY